MYRRGLFLLPLCVALVLSAGIARSGDKTEQAKLEGTWTVVTSSGGTAKPDTKIKKVTFKGDKITFSVGDKTFHTNYAVDPTKKPKTIDLYLIKSDGKKATALGIYDLDGDNLKIAHFEGEKAEKSRPKDFVANAETNVGVLKRDKK